MLGVTAVSKTPGATMGARRALVAGTLMLGGIGPVAGQGVHPACNSVDHHAFDFWLGEWNVHAADGKLAGTNSIRREYGGCVIHERYDTGHGYSGESLNVYDEPRKVWHQSWVDSTGLLLLLEGGIRAGSMVLEGQTIGLAGKVTKQRITWTPYPDGSVRRLWESRAPGGKWTVAFDGHYTHT
jgi:hypothetical protein